MEKAHGKGDAVRKGMPGTMKRAKSASVSKILSI